MTTVDPNGRLFVVATLEPYETHVETPGHKGVISNLAKRYELANSVDKKPEPIVDEHAEGARWYDTKRGKMVVAEEAVLGRFDGLLIHPDGSTICIGELDADKKNGVRHKKDLIEGKGKGTSTFFDTRGPKDEYGLFTEAYTDFGHVGLTDTPELEARGTRVHQSALTFGPIAMYVRKHFVKPGTYMTKRMAARLGYTPKEYDEIRKNWMHREARRIVDYKKRFGKESMPEMYPEPDHNVVSSLELKKSLYLLDTPLDRERSLVIAENPEQSEQAEEKEDEREAGEGEGEEDKMEIEKAEEEKVEEKKGEEEKGEEEKVEEEKVEEKKVEEKEEKVEENQSVEPVTETVSKADSLVPPVDAMDVDPPVAATVAERIALPVSSDADTTAIPPPASSVPRVVSPAVPVSPVGISPLNPSHIPVSVASSLSKSPFMSTPPANSTPSANDTPPPVQSSQSNSERTAMDIDPPATQTQTSPPSPSPSPPPQSQGQGQAQTRSPVKIGDKLDIASSSMEQQVSELTAEMIQQISEDAKRLAHDTASFKDNEMMADRAFDTATGLKRRQEAIIKKLREAGVDSWDIPADINAPLSQAQALLSEYDALLRGAIGEHTGQKPTTDVIQTNLPPNDPRRMVATFAASAVSRNFMERAKRDQAAQEAAMPRGYNKMDIESQILNAGNRKKMSDQAYQRQQQQQRSWSNMRQNGAASPGEFLTVPVKRKWPFLASADREEEGKKLRGSSGSANAGQQSPIPPVRHQRNVGGDAMDIDGEPGPQTPPLNSWGIKGLDDTPLTEDEKNRLLGKPDYREVNAHKIPRDAVGAWASVQGYSRNRAFLNSLPSPVQRSLLAAFSAPVDDSMGSDFKPYKLYNEKMIREIPFDGIQQDALNMFRQSRNRGGNQYY